MKNIGLHVIAMVLAILFWAFVRVTNEGIDTQTFAQVTVSVPLLPQNAAPGQYCYYMSNDTVNVTLRGEQGVVNSLSEAQVKATVDLSGMAAGSQWPQVKVLPPGDLKIVSVNPSTVNVKLSPSSTKLVPVTLVVTGKPGEGMTAGKPTIDPSQVKLSGPDAMLSEVESVQGRLVLDGQTRGFTADINDLEPVNADGTTVATRQYRLRVHPTSVAVTVPIRSHSDSVAVFVSMENVRVIPATNYTCRIEVEPETVTLRVPKDQSPPTALKTRPEIFESPTKVETREVEVVIPDGMEVVGASTVKVRVIPTLAKDSQSLLTPARTPTPSRTVEQP